MATSAARRWAVLGLLGVSLILWAAWLLFQFRVVNIFDAYLMKFPRISKNTCTRSA